ncbi:NYN domain-containing protein [Nodosilinea sp. LEGE 07298]|uniref:NYN domain-containing protein n=1 Tax=Nodosilinea sp. LEGE 07298 TaxID=2777970 RepID=UPI0018814748|nr:NYN domain-containing protein [Nodosilinea sp. LEGE 07298]MBE9112823.1 NYN domain-containing protein [Nodosilinea sp. LEGE 07298]
MTRSPELPNLDLCEAVGQLLHTALMVAQHQHPHILSESGRKWLLANSNEAQIHKITALLAKQADLPALIKAVEHILEQFFTPAFQGSKPHQTILQRVQTLAARSIQSDSHLPQAQAEPTQARGGTTESANFAESGLLLVDAENMSLPEALEDALQKIGQYPIRYRLAFGNWRKLGDRDQALYRRGYQMVHVPSGKNSADIKMSLDAFLISLRNPSIREVFICSTDSDLLHLGHALLSLGITPYRVSGRGNNFAVLNIGTQKRQVIRGATDSTTVGVPSLVQMERSLKKLILEEQQANPGQPITLGRLGTLFRDRNQISASQALQTYADYRNLKQFLEAHDTFELFPLVDGGQIEVRLATPEDRPTSATHWPEAVADQPLAAATGQSIDDTKSLEQALIKLLWSLSSQQSGGSIPLSVLSLHFAHTHQESLSQVLKRLGEPKGLPKFLAKCQALRTYKQGTDWQVALACVS